MIFQEFIRQGWLHLDWGARLLGVDFLRWDEVFLFNLEFPWRTSLKIRGSMIKKEQLSKHSLENESFPRIECLMER